MWRLVALEVDDAGRGSDAEPEQRAEAEADKGENGDHAEFGGRQKGRENGQGQQGQQLAAALAEPVNRRLLADAFQVLEHQPGPRGCGLSETSKIAGTRTRSSGRPLAAAANRMAS